MKIVKGWYLPDSEEHFLNTIGHWPENWYQQKSLDFALKFVSANDCVIDVGANIGLHTVRFSNFFNRVISFEPAKTNFECLMLNTEKFRNVKLFKMALGNTQENKQILIPKDSSSCGGYSFKDFIDFDGETDKEDVQILRLDDLELPVNLIKIDTQGYELEVLTGSLRTLQKYNPVILIETYGPQLNSINSFLKNIGYTKRIQDFKSKDTVWTADS